MSKQTGSRATWKGSVSFGLVSIPVAVKPATREEKVSFRQLRKSDLSPIKYKKVAEADGKEVPTDQIIKGYEYERGSFVTLKDEELDRVRITSTHTIEINDFVDQAQINPKFFHKPYFLEPQKGGEKAYVLLNQALTETGKIGIAKVVISRREYLAGVRAEGKFLILELMHFDAEVLALPDNTVPDIKTLPNELKMAKALVDSMAAPWEPQKYFSYYQGAVLKLIEDKVKDPDLQLEDLPVEKKTDDGDIMKQLEASLKLHDKK